MMERLTLNWKRGRFSADHSKSTRIGYSVNLPSYTAWSEARKKEAQEKKQDASENMIYRLYKGSCWHENQHCQFSPPQFLKGNNDKNLNTNTRRSLFNTIDDRRIEELGVNKLPGFASIRMLRQAYWGSLRPDVGELSKKYTDEKELSGDANLQNSAKSLARKDFKVPRRRGSNYNTD